VAEAIDPSRAWVPGDRRLRSADVTAAAVTLMAVMAQAGHASHADAARAYLAGLGRVYPRINAPYAPPKNMLEALDEVWPKLDHLEPMAKELLIEGLVAAISHDGQVSVSEAELLRTICASLHCPLPPMLEMGESRASCRTKRGLRAGPFPGGLANGGAPAPPFANHPAAQTRPRFARARRARACARIG
jgi:hypothetical protein